MVKRIVIQILFLLLYTAVPVFAQDCYNFTRTQAISFYEKGEYRIARDQFMAAKDCPDKPADNDLDTWIAKCDSALAELERKAEAERLRRAEEERIKEEILSSPYHNGHRFVDLGLSVLWADCNIGASSPEEYGNYYAYGEVTTKEMYSPDNYLYGEYDDNKGVFTDLTRKKMPYSICNTQYDIAHTIWGGSWRMPTKSEVKELFDSCKIEKEGNLLKLTGPNGNYIFLPLGGWKYRSQNCNTGSECVYWTGNNSDHFHDSGGDENGIKESRLSSYCGALIRPVIDF